MGELILEGWQMGIPTIVLVNVGNQKLVSDRQKDFVDLSATDDINLRVDEINRL